MDTESISTLWENQWKNPLSPSLQVPSNAQKIKKDFQPQAVPQCSDIYSKNNVLSKIKITQQTQNQMKGNCTTQPVHRPLPQLNKTNHSFKGVQIQYDQQTHHHLPSAKQISINHIHQFILIYQQKVYQPNWVLMKI